MYSEKYLDKSLHESDWWHCNTIGERVEAAVDDIDGWNFRVRGVLHFVPGQTDNEDRLGRSVLVL